jgi:hypothetical protein
MGTQPKSLPHSSYVHVYYYLIQFLWFMYASVEVGSVTLLQRKTGELKQFFNNNWLSSKDGFEALFSFFYYIPKIG